MKTHFFLLHLLCLLVSATAQANFDHSPYTTLLQQYVNEEGEVDYQELKNNRGLLDQYLQSLEVVKADVFKRWKEADQIAYLLNAYNAKTLEVIIDHYPISSNWKAKIRKFPLGIRHIPGAWDDFTIRAGGRKLSLNGIEHEVLRKEYNEPRIHMGLVCASVGCPFLRTEAYTGDRLVEQLDAQTRQFLTSPKGVQLDPAQGVVRISAIFKWFGEDFVRKGYSQPEINGYNDRDHAILSFILPYLAPSQAKILASQRFKVDYLDYDWGLNEQ